MTNLVPQGQVYSLELFFNFVPVKFDGISEQILSY